MNSIQKDQAYMVKCIHKKSVPSKHETCGRQYIFKVEHVHSPTPVECHPSFSKTAQSVSHLGEHQLVGKSVNCFIMAVNIPGVIVMMLFYLLVLATGIWASFKSRRKQKKTAANEMEMVLLGNRGISWVVGIFTMTGEETFTKLV